VFERNWVVSLEGKYHLSFSKVNGEDLCLSLLLDARLGVLPRRVWL